MGREASPMAQNESSLFMVSLQTVLHVAVRLRTSCTVGIIDAYVDDYTDTEGITRTSHRY